MRARPKVLIALRTHFWDETVERIAQHLYGLSMGYDFTVIADETTKIIDTGNFPKISHTNRSDEIGLPHWPSSYNNLHYNGDYVFYFLQKHSPGYDYYLLVENDTFVNISLDTLFIEAMTLNADLAAKVDEIDSEHHKEFHRNSTRWYSNFGRCFFPFVLLSQRAVQDLYDARRAMKKNLDNEMDWPYCESFVASHILSDKKYSIIDLESHADLTNFTFMNHKYINDVVATKIGSVSHPIVGKNFAERNLHVNNIGEIFNPNSNLRRGLNSMDAGDVREIMPVLERAIDSQTSRETKDSFDTLALSKNWFGPDSFTNRALHKPATQSSVGPYSHNSDVISDAAQLVDGILSNDTKSHTGYEYRPWVEIDLKESFNIKSIFIFVRPHNFHIFNNFFISFSENSEDWEIVYRKLDGLGLDSSDMKPIILNFKRGYQARFVRVTLDDTECLALNQIQIFSYE